MSGGRAGAGESRPSVWHTRCDTTDPDHALAVCRDLSPRLYLAPAGPPADFAIGFEAVRLGPVTISTLTVGGAVRLQTAGLEVAYHVYLPLTGSLELDHRTESVIADPTRAAVQRATGAGIVHLPPGVRVLTVGLDRHALEHRLEELLGRPAPSPIPLAAALDVASGAGLSWARTVRLLAGVGPDSLLWRPPMVEVMRLATLTGLLLAVEHPHRGQLHREHAPTRPRTVKRAIDAMRSDPAHPFTTFDLAAIAGVSRRALQEGFRQHLGVSPMTYLRHVRLECARDHLRHSPGMTVAEIARRCGFTNLGRFAAAYRSRFGVSPSQTRRDSSQRRPGRSGERGRDSDADLKR
jgi:AraC-like DNA-binding protein